jgi:hypothetical protein
MSSGIKDELMRYLHHLDPSEGLRREALGPVTHISITDRQQGVSDGKNDMHSLFSSFRRAQSFSALPKKSNSMRRL